MKLVLTYNELQEINTDNYRKFQVYFYKNLFYPLKNSKIQEHEKLTKKKIETILDEIFVLNKEENERRVREFAKEAGI